MHPDQAFQAILNQCWTLDDEYYASGKRDVGEKLGHYDDERQLVCFYGVRNTLVRMAAIRARLDLAGIPYTLTVEHPTDAESNVTIHVNP